MGDLRGPGVSPFENRNMVQIVFTAAGSELLSREVTVHSNERRVDDSVEGCLDSVLKK